MVTIYDKNGTLRTNARVIRREGTFLNVATVTVTIESPTTIPFAVGDYLDYCGWRYTVYCPCVPTRNAATSSCGDAFEYQQVFKCATEDLRLCIFRDLVLSDNNVHFTSLPDVSTFENVYGIADRIQANMNATYGVGVWNISVVNVVSGTLYELLHTAKEFSLSNSNCLEALTNIYNVWDGVGWMYSCNNGVHTITIGKNCVESGNVTEQFAYGKGNGLSLIKGEVKNADEISTVIVPYGGSENMQSRYYNGITYNGHPLIGDAMHIPNLLIPYSYWGTTRWYSWTYSSITIYTETSTPTVNLNTYSEPNIGSPYGGITMVNADNTIVVNGYTFTPTGNYVSYPDVRKAFISNANALSVYGRRERVIYFDGSDNYEDIHPSIEGITIGEVISAKSAAGDTTYVPTGYVSSERVDEIKSAVNPSDTGTNTGTDGKVLTGNVSWALGTTYTTDFTRASAERTRVVIPLKLMTNSSVTGRNKLTFTIPAYSGTVYITDSTETVQFISGVSSIMGSLRLKAGNTYIDKCSIPFTLTEHSADASHDRMYYTFATTAQTLTAPRAIDQCVLGFEISTLGIPIDEGDMSVGDAYSITVECVASASANIKWVRSLSNVFYVTLKQIGFDIMAQKSSDDMPALSMKSGYCAGREFQITNCVYNSSSDDWTITCKRDDDADIGLMFPNANTTIKAGDRFVLLNIQMPGIYVDAKATHLYSVAQNVLSELSNPNMAYSAELNQIAMLQKMESASYDFPIEGKYLNLYDADIVGSTAQNILIDSFSINEDGINAPSFTIGLKEKKMPNIFDRIAKAQKKSESKIVNDERNVSFVLNSVRLNEEESEDSARSYLELSDKPSINGQTLEGNMVLASGGNVDDVRIAGVSILDSNRIAQIPYRIVVKSVKESTDTDVNTIYFYTSSNA